MQLRKKFSLRKGEKEMLKPNFKRATFLICLFVMFPSVMGFAVDFINIQPDMDMGPGGAIVDLYPCIGFGLAGPLPGFPNALYYVHKRSPSGPMSRIWEIQ